MALLKRTDLREKGLTDEQIDYVMTEANRALNADYLPRMDVQTQIDAAVANATKDFAPIDPTTTDQYKALLAENAKIKALGSDDFSGVKAPYREMVWDKLDHSEKHKPYAEQLQGMAETMPDIFAAKQTEETEQPAEKQPKAVFGAETTGAMPKGKPAPSFMDAWGFVPKQNT